MFTTLATIWILHVAAMMSSGANVLLVSQLAASDRTANAMRAALGITVGAAIWSASALFFGSVFAASFPHVPSHTLQVAAVVMIVGNALLWHTLLAYLFSRQRVRQAYARGKTGANRVAGLLLGTMGLGLLAATAREARG